MKLLTNTDKAKLLHELFPEEVPLLLDNIKGFCADFITFQELYRKNWSGLMHFDLWLSFAEETAGLIRKRRPQMLKSSRVFSEQLCVTYAVKCTSIYSKQVRPMANARKSKSLKVPLCITKLPANEQF